MLVQCPFHDDHDPSMSINLEDGRWYCFTESQGGDYVELIARLKRHGQFAEGVPKPYQAKEEPMLKSWAERGFTSAMLVKWGIVWDREIHAMRIPVLSEEGNQVANIWRAPEGVEPKYRYDAGFAKSEFLFGLWRLTNPLPMIVLVEGPLDAIWVQDCGVPCVAILGGDFSSDQLELLISRSVRKAVLCFDNDVAGANATFNARDKLRAAGMWVYRVRLPSRYKDIQEVPHEKVVTLVAESELSVKGNIVHPRFQRWVGNEEQVGSSIWRNR